MPKIKPMLRYAGGKSRQVKSIYRYWKPHSWRQWIAFAGGLGDTLGLMPKKAILVDINPDLIEFYRWVQKGLVFDIPMYYDEDLYYQYRQAFNVLANPVMRGLDRTNHRAQLFYYLNKTGFNGIQRTNASLGVNTPIGRPSSGTIKYPLDLLDYRETLKPWKFICCDFEKIPVDPLSYFYCDPPYDSDGKPTFSYAGNKFDWDEQVRLAEFLSKLPNPVLTTNRGTNRIIDLYSSLGFRIDIEWVKSSIGCKGDRRSIKLPEMYAHKNL